MIDISKLNCPERGSENSSKEQYDGHPACDFSSHDNVDNVDKRNRLVPRLIYVEFSKTSHPYLSQNDRKTSVCDHLSNWGCWSQIENQMCNYDILHSFLYTLSISLNVIDGIVDIELQLKSGYDERACIF